MLRQLKQSHGYASLSCSLISLLTSALQIGPSLTPLTGLNSGFRVYEVDTGVSTILELSYQSLISCQSFDILDAHTWASMCCSTCHH